MIVYYLILSIACVFALAYVVLIALYCYGWVKTTSYTFSEKLCAVKVCVIIPARNEADNIEACVLAVLAQNYPHHLMEIMVVDDCSEDNTSQIVQKLKAIDKRINLISLDPNTHHTGKKAAINKAIHVTNAELIITTDADCTMGNNWAATLVSIYNQTSAKMICGPVMLNRPKGLFEKMQQLELSALIASSAASLFYNKATLCNGANLAYTKEAYLAVNGFNGIDEKPSGDDVLLMYKIKEKYNGSVFFIKEKAAMVYTKPMLSLSDFFSQRRRWTSKEFELFNIETQVTSIIVGGFNLLLCMLFIIISVFGVISTHENSGIEFFYLLLGIKCIIDFLLLFLASSFFGTKQYLKYFLLQEILYVPYVFVIWVASLQKKYEWKGRIYS